MSVLVCALLAAPAAFAGCYDDRVGEEFTLNVGDEFCLKNTKWSCKPLCFYFAGMPDKDAFSLGVARHQGALNLFYPYAGPGKSSFSISGHRFTVLQINPELMQVRYDGE